MFLIILDILADTDDGFEGAFAHQLAVGMPEDDRNKFGASFVFEYIKLLKKILFHFIDSRSYFELSN